MRMDDNITMRFNTGSSSTRANETVSVISRHDLESFCQRDAFKRYVREAINEEHFWKDIFRSLQITNQVDNHLNTNVPRRIDNHLSSVLAGRITIEVLNQLPSIVSNNHQMHEILKNHKEQLNRALQDAGRQILDQIVNEDDYHEVNKAYFAAFESKGLGRLNKFDEQGQTTLRHIENDYQQKLDSLNKSLQEVNHYHQRVKDLEEQVNWVIKGFYGLSLVVMLSGGFYLFNR